MWTSPKGGFAHFWVLICSQNIVSWVHAHKRMHARTHTYTLGNLLPIIHILVHFWCKHFCSVLTCLCKCVIYIHDFLSLQPDSNFFSLCTFFNPCPPQTNIHTLNHMRHVNIQDEIKKSWGSAGLGLSTQHYFRPLMQVQLNKLLQSCIDKEGHRHNGHRDQCWIYHLLLYLFDVHDDFHASFPCSTILVYKYLHSNPDISTLSKDTLVVLLPASLSGSW